MQWRGLSNSLFNEVVACSIVVLFVVEVVSGGVVEAAVRIQLFLKCSWRKPRDSLLLQPRSYWHNSADLLRSQAAAPWQLPSRFCQYLQDQCQGYEVVCNCLGTLFDLVFRLVLCLYELQTGYVFPRLLLVGILFGTIKQQLYVFKRWPRSRLDHLDQV